MMILNLTQHAATDDQIAAGVTEPLYSFTRREAVDVPQPDGSVRKTQIFRHVCFLAAIRPPEER